MKNLCLVPLFFFALSTLPAQAAILYLPLECDPLYSVKDHTPVPDAPTYSLNCYSRSAISGTGTSCVVNVTTLGGDGTAQQVFLQQSAEDSNTITFNGNGYSVLFDKVDITATITAGNNATDCTYTPPSAP